MWNPLKSAAATAQPEPAPAPELPPEIPEVEDILQTFRGMRNDYKLGRPSRFRRHRAGMPATGVQSDWHIRQETAYYRDLEIARDMENNTPVISMGLRKLAANVLVNGTGIVPDTGDPVIDEDLSSQFKERSDETTFDYYDEMSVSELERVAMRRWIVDGDIWCMWTEEQNAQLIEGHNCRGAGNMTDPLGRVRLGVQLDENLRKRGILVRSIPSNVYQQNVTEKDIQQRDLYDGWGRLVQQIFEPTRIAATRGFTYLNPVTEVSEKHEEIQLAKLIQCQAVSAFAIIRNQQYDPTPRTPIQPGSPASNSGMPPAENVKPGYHVRTAPGESITGFSPNVPNPEFFDLSHLLLTLLSVNIDLPLVCLMLDGSQTNFSGFRGALEQARLRFVQIQMMLWRKVRRFIYLRHLLERIRLEPALERAGNRQGINLLRCRPILPIWPYLEPLQDTKAHLIQLRSGMTSRRRFHASQGRQHEQIARELVEDAALEIELAMERAADINGRFPDQPPVHWRQLINLPTPEGIQGQLDLELAGSAGAAAPADVPPPRPAER